MNLEKSYEYFQPEKAGRVHILGCGSVGSTIAENLARMGIEKFTLWDFDKVEKHNIVNQMFLQEDIGKNKAEATAEIICRINPEAASKIVVKTEGWDGENISGHLFLAPDNIDVRRAVLEKNMTNEFLKSVWDFRTELEVAQHYAADWRYVEHKKFMLGTMNFTHEDASNGAVSACGVTLGVCPTVRTICSIGAANFINFIRGKGMKKMVIADCFGIAVDAFDAEV